MPRGQRDPAIAAVILAAGMSRRMGRPKALLPLGAEPLIRRVVQTISAVRSVSPLIVVSGHSQADVVHALNGLPVTIAHNPDYDAGGMLSSVQTGLRAVPDDADAVLVMLCDQPLIKTTTIQLLIDSWRPLQPPAAVPVYQSKRGHPLLVHRRGFDEILALAAGETLRTFVARHERELLELPVDDPATITDVDTPEDYERMLNQYKSLEGQDHAPSQPLAEP